MCYIRKRIWKILKKIHVKFPHSLDKKGNKEGKLINTYYCLFSINNKSLVKIALLKLRLKNEFHGQV